MKKLKQVTEAEVISDFLRAEFYHPEYDRDRARFEGLVYEPDVRDAGQNALRRALLFRRRGHMWRELPPDTQWWELEFKPEEVRQVNVFPRAQWRTPARGNFAAVHVAEQIRRDMGSPNPSALSLRIKVISSLMERGGSRSTVLLIGLDEHHPVTLLEGNHRFIAFMMLPQEIMLRRLRIVCGFSPRMEECCWYKTNLPTLYHYLKNRIKYFWDREADVYRLLPLDGAQSRPVKSQESKLAAGRR
jgi:hypothetical protein